MGGPGRGEADAGGTAMTIPPRTTTTITRGAAAMVRLTRRPTGTASGPDIARRTGMAGPARTGRLAATAGRTPLAGPKITAGKASTPTPAGPATRPGKGDRTAT